MAKTIELLLRVLLAGIFIFSGLLKLRDPGRFLVDLQGFEIFPVAVAFGLALFVPVFELVLGVSILLKRFYLGSLLLYGLTVLGFMGLILYGIVSQQNFDCGCFGDWFVFPNPWIHLGFNGLLVIVAGALFFQSLAKQVQVRI